MAAALKSLVVQNTFVKFHKTHVYPIWSRFLAIQNANTEVNVSRKNLKPFSDIPKEKEGSFLRLYKVFKKRKNIHLYVNELIDEYGPILRTSMAGQNNVYVTDLTAVEKLFRHEPKYPLKIDVPLWKMQRDELGLGLGIILSDGEDWWKIRRCANKVFLNTHKIATNAKYMNAVNLDFVEYLKNKRGQNNDIVLDDFLSLWIMEIGWAVLYQKRMGCFDETPPVDADAAVTAMRTFFEVSHAMFFLKPSHAKVLMRKNYNKSLECMRTIFRIGKNSIDEMVQRMKAKDKDSNEEKDGILAELLLSAEEENLSEKEVLAMMIELMSASLDTTSNVALFLLDEMSRRPDVQERIYEEILNVSPKGEMPSAEMLQNTPFLRACVKETLRMYPVGFVIPRILQEDTEIMGYLVPAKTHVIIPLYTISLDERYYEHPKEFDPERWLRDADGGRKVKTNPFAFLPFGFGVRSCVGRRLAELELYTLLFQMIQNFRLEAKSLEPLGMKSRLALVPNREIKVKLHDRH